VVVEGGRCLVLRRADRDEWIFPKGHLEVGEDPATAARREVAEETGLQVDLLAELGSTRYRFGPGGRQRKRVDWFLAQPVGGQLAPEAIFAEAAFLSWDEAAARLSHEDDRKILAEARRMVSTTTDA
jgi:8-oxo-dGTP pyrophosphatase MutT (NUDIX family)